MNTVSMFSMFSVLVYLYILHVSEHNGKVTVLHCPKSHWALMSYTNVLRTTLLFVCLISKLLSYKNKGNTAEFYDQAVENYDTMSVSTQLPRSLLQHRNSFNPSLDNLKILTVQHLSKVVLKP